MSLLIIKDIKFEVRIQDLMKHSYKTKKAKKKTQEDHLEEGKTATLAKGTKSGKRRKRAMESLKSENSTLPLKSTRPNTLNASSPS
jgi:hypothetical protein